MTIPLSSFSTFPLLSHFPFPLFPFLGCGLEKMGANRGRMERSANQYQIRVKAVWKNCASSGSARGTGTKSWLPSDALAEVAAPAATAATVVSAVLAVSALAGPISLIERIRESIRVLVGKGVRVVMMG